MSILAAIGSAALRFGIGKLVSAGLVAVAISAAGVYVWSLKAKAESANARADRAMVAYQTASDAAAANLDALNAYKANAKRAQAALESERAASRDMASRVEKLQREIDRAEVSRTECVPGNDDPVPPVLDLAIDGDIDGMRGEASAGSRHKGGG